MPVSITCSCGVFLEVDDRFAGQTINCPDCQKPLKAPSLDPLPQRTSGLALASLVSALVGAFTVVVPFIAAGLGVLALRRIDRHADRLAGRRIAWAGIVLGVLFGAAGVYVYRAGLIDPDRMVNRQPLAGKLKWDGDTKIIKARDRYSIDKPSDKWGEWYPKADGDAAPVSEPLVLINPKEDAYITCLVLRLDGLSLAECKDRALREYREPDFSGSADSRRTAPALVERSSRLLPKENGMEQMEVELEKTTFGQHRTYLARVIKAEGSSDVFLLVGSVRKSRFRRLKEELETAFNSFRIQGGND